MVEIATEVHYPTQLSSSVKSTGLQLTSGKPCLCWFSLLPSSLVPRRSVGGEKGWGGGFLFPSHQTPGYEANCPEEVGHA